MVVGHVEAVEYNAIELGLLSFYDALPICPVLELHVRGYAK